jgi:hypothetical protein
MRPRRRLWTVLAARPLLAALALRAALALLAAPPLAAQIEQHPGYFPVEDFGILAPESLTLEVNLGGSMLGLIAAALDDEEPEFSELVRGLAGIRVRIAEAADLDLEALRSGFHAASAWLEEQGWEPFVRLREDDEELYVFMRVIDDEMVGATLLALEPEAEVVMVNVVGRLDPALLASLADSLDIPQLDLRDLEQRDPGEDEDGDEGENDR